MEAKVKERFEQAQALYEKEFKAYYEALITWWNDTFSQGLGDMLNGLYKGWGDYYVTVDVVNSEVNDRYRFDLHPHAPNDCYIIMHNNKEVITTKIFERDISTLDKLKSRIEDLKRMENDFEFFKERTEEIVEAITTAYDDKVTQQNEDLDEIFDMLGQETETTKRCKVTVEWI